MNWFQDSRKNITEKYTDTHQFWVAVNFPEVNSSYVDKAMYCMFESKSSKQLGIQDRQSLIKDPMTKVTKADAGSSQLCPCKFKRAIDLHPKLKWAFELYPLYNLDF